MVCHINERYSYLGMDLSYKKKLVVPFFNMIQMLHTKSQFQPWFVLMYIGRWGTSGLVYIFTTRQPPCCKKKKIG